MNLGFWPCPGCLRSLPSQTTCGNYLPTTWSVYASPSTVNLPSMQFENGNAYEKMARGTIPEGVVMASGNLGRFYFLPDLEVIDTDGLTDATIARTPVTRPNTRRLIAHDRKPPSGYLEQRGVNIWIDAPAASESTALARGDYAVKVGPDLWMPFKTRDPQIVIDLLLQTSPESRPTWTFTQPHSKRADVTTTVASAFSAPPSQPASPCS